MMWLGRTIALPFKVVWYLFCCVTRRAIKCQVLSDDISNPPHLINRSRSSEPGNKIENYIFPG